MVIFHSYVSLPEGIWAMNDGNLTLGTLIHKIGELPPGFILFSYSKRTKRQIQAPAVTREIKLWKSHRKFLGPFFFAVVGYITLSIR